MSKIRDEIMACYEAQRQAVARIEELRRTCPHAERFQGLYSWRLGSTELAWLCKECDQYLGPASDSPNCRHILVVNNRCDKCGDMVVG